MQGASTEVTKPQSCRLNPRRWFFGIVAVLVTATTAWFVVEALQPNEPIRIAINSWPGYEFAYLANELGYFEDEGLQVKLLEFGSLSDARRSFERGQCDGFFGTVFELVEARANSNRNPQAVLACDYSNGGDVIIARSNTNTVTDLAGKRVGIERGSLNIYVLGRALEQFHLSWSDIEPVYMSNVEMPASFLNGTVDAIVTYPPVSIGIEQTGGHVIFSTREIPREVIDIFAVAEDFASARTEDIQAFTRAYFRAVEFNDDNPEIAQPIMAARQRISTEAFASVIADDLELIQLDVQDAYLKEGGLVDQAVVRTTRVIHQLQEATVERDHGRWATIQGSED